MPLCDACLDKPDLLQLNAKPPVLWMAICGDCGERRTCLDYPRSLLPKRLTKR